MAIVADCNSLFKKVENRISEIIDKTSEKFKGVKKAAEKMIGKNLLFNFVCAIVLFVAVNCFHVYIQNYRDGTEIAEAKAVEALAEERAKFESEILAESQE